MGVNSYISIGNSDDRLSQAEWSRCVAEVRDLLRLAAGTLQVHGEWFAGPDQPWQNANWCVEILPPTWWRVQNVPGAPPLKGQAARYRDEEMDRTRDQLKEKIRRLCERWRQDSFAWTTGPVELVETGLAREREVERRAYPELIERERTLEQFKGRLDTAMGQAIREGWATEDGKLIPAIPSKQEIKEYMNRPGLLEQQMGIEPDDCLIEIQREGLRFQPTPGPDTTPTPQEPASTGDGEAETVGEGVLEKSSEGTEHGE